jgi:3-hydroxybutyryl-CoA dehydratase
MTDAQKVAVTPITPDLLRVVGVESAPYFLEVEKGDLLRFALATGTDNEAFLDEGASRRTPSRGLVAAPTYLLVMRGLEHRALAQLGWVAPSKGVDGGSEWTFHEPVRPGDTITATATIEDLFHKHGRLGQMLFQIVGITYRNQLGQVVTTQRDTRIFYS